MAEGKPVWLFYHIQNDRGESSAHPNATKLPPPPPGQRLTLADVQRAFPLTGTGSFHFRFQVAADKQTLFLDLVNPADAVPLVGGNVICKVLRLDTLRVPTRNVPGLKLKSYSSGSGGAALAPIRSSPVAPSTVAAARGSPSSAAAAPSASGAAAVPWFPVAGKTPKPTGPTRDDQTVELHIKDTGEPDGPVSNAAPLGEADERGYKPIKVLDASVGAAVAPPAVVDADLEGKSAWVQAQVMARREEAEAKAKARLAEVAAREAEAASAAAEADAAKEAYGARLTEWTQEPNGQKKNVRLLLSTLHTVLWAGAKWEPVPLAKLVLPAHVKARFLKAVTVVHPDKQAGMADAGQRFIANAVFHALESAYRAFQETEMGGG